MILAVVLRPKDEGAGLKLLHLQFFFFAIGGFGSFAVGSFQDGEETLGFALLAVFLLLLTTYWLGMKLRRKAALLPPAEISNFLCHTVLIGGVSAMAPMIFFMFEAVSCMASGDGLEDNQCENTTGAAMFLSVYLAITTAISIASRTVPQGERGDGMTYINLAILRLKMKEKVQGALGVIVVLASMFLFSVLGVEGTPNETINWVGAAGMGTLGIAGFIEGALLAFSRSVPTGDGQAGSSGSLGQPSNTRRSRSASLGDIAENMTIAGLV